MPENQEEESVEISTGVGKVRARGPAVYLVILIICAAAAGAWMLRDHDLRASERSDKIVDQQQKLEEGIHELTWVLTLTEEERKRLQLQMPPSMRKKLLDQERDERRPR